MEDYYTDDLQFGLDALGNLDLEKSLHVARQSLSKVDRCQQKGHNNSSINRDLEMSFPQFQAMALESPRNLSLCHANQALRLPEESFLKSQDTEELVSLLGEIETLRQDYLTTKQRCAELEEQLRDIIQENLCLQGRLSDTRVKQEMSMHEELSLLDEVQQGLMCSRCLRGIHSTDKQTSTEEISPWKDGFQKPGGDLQLNFIDSSNPNHDLVKKYEALLEEHGTTSASRNIAEAKKSSDWNPPLAQQQKEETIVGSSKKSVVSLKIGPIEFWKAKTSSRGKKNKSSQTKESHFRHRSENRKHIKDVFGGLKQAEVGQETKADITVPQVAIPSRKKESPKIVSSIMSCRSIARSEVKPKRKRSKNNVLSSSSNSSSLTPRGSSTKKPIGESSRPKPIKREPLEHRTTSVVIKQKDPRRPRHKNYYNVNQNSPQAIGQQHQERMIRGNIPASLNRGFGRRGNEYSSSAAAFSGKWTGATIVIYNRNMDTSFKRCNMSYAEVLRRTHSFGDYIP